MEGGNGVTDIILINIFTSRNQVTEKPVLNHLIFNSLLPAGDTSQLFQHIPRLQSHPRTTEPSAPSLRMLKIPGWHRAWDPKIVLLKDTTFPNSLKSVPAFQSSRNRLASGCLVANS